MSYWVCFSIRCLWSCPTDCRQVGQFSKDVIWSLSFCGLSFCVSRAEIRELISRNSVFFSLSVFLCFSMSSKTALNLTSEKSDFSWVCFCIRNISFFILNSKSFLPWINAVVFTSSDSNVSFSSIKSWFDVSFSSACCFFRIRFWYSKLRLFDSLAIIIFFSFSNVNFSLIRFSSDARISLIFTASLIFWRRIWELSFILLYRSIPNMCLRVSSLTSGFSWMIAFISSWGV